jgi:hypothetical protein
MAARVRVRFPLIDLTGETPDIKNAIRRKRTRTRAAIAIKPTLRKGSVLPEP